VHNILKKTFTEAFSSPHVDTSEQKVEQQW